MVWVDGRDSSDFRQLEIYFKRSIDAGENWDDAGGDPGNYDGTRRLTETQPPYIWGGYSNPRIDVSGRELHLLYAVSDVTHWPAKTSRYLRSLDGGETWDDGQDSSKVGREFEGVFPDVAAVGKEVSISTNHKLAGYTFGVYSELSHTRGATWEDGEYVTDFPDHRMFTDVYALGFGVYAHAPVEMDDRGGVYVVWRDFLRDCRFTYYSKHVTPIVRLTHPDQAVSTVSMEYVSGEWIANVELEEMGLYTAEVIAHDEAGNHGKAYSFFGRMNWNTGGDRVEYFAFHEDDTFSAARMGLLSVPALLTGPEVIDQFADRTQGWVDIPDNWLSQSFKPAEPFLSSVDLMLYRDPLAEAVLFVEIRESDGSGIPSDTALTRELIHPDQIPLSAGWVHIDFPDISVIVDDSYHIVVGVAADVPIPTGSVYWATNSEEIYVRGRLWTYLNQWIEHWPQSDAVFQTYSPIPEPKTDQFMDEDVDGQQGMPGLDHKLAQSFTPTYPVLSGVDVKIRSSSAADEDVWLEIHTDDLGGHPSGMVLTRNIIDGVSIPPEFSWISVDFADTPVIPGDTYHIVLGFVSDPDPTLEWAWNGQDVYIERGEAQLDDGSGWTSLPGKDYLFRTSAAPVNLEQNDQSLTYRSTSSAQIAENWLSQSFKPSRPILSSVSLMLRKEGTNPEPDLWVEIRESDGYGLPSDTILTRNLVMSEELDTDWSFVYVDLPDVFVTAGQSYHIVLKLATDPSQGTVGWATNSEEIYVRGRLLSYINQWLEYWPQSDTLFSTHTTISVPEVVDQLMDEGIEGEESMDSLDDGLAQSFTPTYPVLSGVDVKIRSSSAADEDVWLEIQGDSGGSPSGTVLTRYIINGGTIPPDYTWLRAHFADISVIPGDTYHIVLRFVSDPDPTLEWAWNGQDVYIERGLAQRRDDGGSFTPLTGKDYLFKTRTSVANPEVMDQFLEDETIEGSKSMDTMVDELAQSFRPSYPVLSSVEVSIESDPYEAQDVWVEIQTDSGGHPSGSVLARSIIEAEEIPSTFSPVPVDFSDISVNPSETYHIVLRFLFAVDLSLEWAWNEQDAYMRGEAQVNNDGGGWTSLPGKDFLFRVYARTQHDVVTNPEFECGDVDPLPEWFYSGRFYGSQITDDFKDDINSYPSSSGDSPDLLGYYHVPFRFHSDSAGVLIVWSVELLLV